MSWPKKPESWPVTTEVLFKRRGKRSFLLQLVFKSGAYIEWYHDKKVCSVPLEVTKRPDTWFSTVGSVFFYERRSLYKS